VTTVAGSRELARPHATTALILKTSIRRRPFSRTRRQWPCDRSFRPQRPSTRQGDRNQQGHGCQLPVPAFDDQRDGSCIDAGKGNSFCETLTPSLPDSVKYPGRKMHGHACRLYIFWSYFRSVFNAMLFMKILAHVSAKRRKKAQEFQISHFIGRFQLTSWQ